MTLLDLDDSALLVIDVQSDFYKAGRDDVDRRNLDRVFATVAWVTAAARALDVPTLVTEEDPAGNGPTTGVVAARLGPAARVFPKRTFAAPDDPPIRAAIEETARGTAVVIGMETDICVAHTALRLRDLGKRAVVVHDATYAPGAAHANGLSRLRDAGVELLSAKEVLYDWLRTVERIRAFRRAHPDLSAPPTFAL